jgi:GPI-anchor transamidase subunit T
MGVHYKNIGPEHELIQTISVVLNSNSNQFSNWNLNSIFEKQNVWTCPFSKSTEIYFESIKEFENNFEMKPEMNKFKELIHFKEFKDEKILFEFKLKKKIPVFYNYPSLSLITVKRYQTGFGLFEGGLVTKITNNINETVEIKFYDAIPWYFRLYFHKVEFKLNSKIINSINFKINYLDVHLSVKSAEMKSKPYVYQFVFNLPPLSTLEWELEFDKLFLGYLEHSPGFIHHFNFKMPIGVSIFHPHLWHLISPIENLFLDLNGIQF